MPALSDCPCSGKNLPKLVRPAVLLVLSEGRLHGYEIAQRLMRFEMFRDQPPDKGGIYRILKEMEEQGHVSSIWDNEQSGPARHEFRLTPAGRKCLKQWRGSLTVFQEQLTDLLAQLETFSGKARRNA